MEGGFPSLRPVPLADKANAPVEAKEEKKEGVPLLRKKLEEGLSIPLLLQQREQLK